MPRVARVKSEESVYHVMVRSISEVKMFKKKDDKMKYIFFIKRCLRTYKFRVLAYCIMDNHAHFIIDGCGADISKVMHNINFCYAIYYNKTYGRHGHLFQDRFKSKIVFDDRYLLNLSAYIHNNPHDIKRYENSPEKYEFSSLSTYLGMNVADSDPLVSTALIKSVMGKDPGSTREAYMELVRNAVDEDMTAEVEFENEGTDYVSCRKIIHRNADPERIIDYICRRLNLRRERIHVKYSREALVAKGLIMYLMRCLCNSTCRDMCSTLGGITQSTASRYCSEGLKLLEGEEYRHIAEDFLRACEA